MENVLALILAGGASERLSILTSERAKPAVPFGGKYRIIDFTLSNCINSAIQNVAVLTQFNPRSLARHIGVGRAWDLDRSGTGIGILHPFLSRTKRGWYKGTADAVYQNLYFVEEQEVDEVLILSGDHIYTMRYDHMIVSHRKRKADITIGLTRVPLAEASRFGIVTLDRNGWIVTFSEKPKKPKSNLASMGIYVFNKNVLVNILETNVEKKGGHDFGRDIIPQILSTYRVYGYRHKGYFRDIGTIDSYWNANRDLIVDLPDLNLYDPRARVRTALQNQNMPPAKLGPKAQVSRSLISDGAMVNGLVENSVISPGVFIEEGARVRDSIIFADSVIGKGAVVDRCIIDKQVLIGAGCHIGYGDDMTPNQEEPEYLNTGITVVAKGAKIPDGVRIGRNCKIGHRIEKTDFGSDSIPSGGSVSRKIRGRHGI